MALFKKVGQLFKRNPKGIPHQTDTYEEGGTITYCLSKNISPHMTETNSINTTNNYDVEEKPVLISQPNRVEPIPRQAEEKELHNG